MTDPFLRVQHHLTHRDHVLLVWLADHGVLTSAQIAHALFPSLDFAQKRLLKLTHLGVIDRFRPNKADGGTYPYHYVLGQLGVEVVAMQRGDELPRRDQARRRRWQLTNRANLPHLLAVNQFFTDLAGYARTHPDATLHRWWPESRCRGYGAFLDPADPAQHGQSHRAKVRPDGHGIWTNNGTTVSFFTEIDLGTETLSTVISKLDGYTDLADAYQRQWLVLFWLSSPLREKHLHQKLAQKYVTVPVATAVLDSTRPHNTPAHTVWWLHRHTGPRLSLSDIAAIPDPPR